MKHIDEPRLETDLAYRFQYLTEFMGFTEEDIKTIHGGAALLAWRHWKARPSLRRSGLEVWC